MKRSRGFLLLFAGLAIAGLLAFGVAATWGKEHVRAVTGEQGQEVMCTNCHGADSPQARYKAGAHASPWALAPGPSGHTLYAACGPARALAVIDLQATRTRRFIPVNGWPRGLALSPDKRTLAISLKDRAQVVFLDTTTNRTTREVDVGRGPAGLAWNADGTHLFVANADEGSVSVLEWPSGREVRRVPAGREPYVVTRSPRGDLIAVVSRRAELDRPENLPRSRVSLLDARDGRPLRSVYLDSCHMSEGAAFTPDGAFLLVPTILVRNRLPILQVARGWVMSSVMAVVDVQRGRVANVPLTEVNEGFPDPSGVSISPDGKRAYVAVGGSDELAVLDLPALLEVAAGSTGGQTQPLEQSACYLERRVPVGANPRGVLSLPSDSAARLAVSARLDDAIVLLDADGEVRSRIALSPGTAEDSTHRGERNFHSADFAFQHAFSCRSCHPDGHTDGLVYDFEIDGVGHNLLLNRSLHGVAGTGPFKWSGKNPTIERQCGVRFAMVLTRADPLAGQGLQDLVSFLHSLRPPAPDPGAAEMGGSDNGAAERGRRLFERSTSKDGTPIPASGRCVTCHPPPLYTSRMRADVGTKGPRDSTGLFDVPHLTGAGSKAPYLHDGRALTLEEIWTAPDVGDRHGVVTDLNKADLNDLVVFMKGL